MHDVISEKIRPPLNEFYELKVSKTNTRNNGYMVKLPKTLLFKIILGHYKRVVSYKTVCHIVPFFVKKCYKKCKYIKILLIIERIKIFRSICLDVVYKQAVLKCFT